MDFALKSLNFALTSMNFVLTSMNFALKSMNFALKLMNFALKSMNFVLTWRILLQMMNFVFQMMMWREVKRIAHKRQLFSSLSYWTCGNNGEFPLKNDDFLLKNGRLFWNWRYGKISIGTYGATAAGYHAQVESTLQFIAVRFFHAEFHCFRLFLELFSDCFPTNPRTVWDDFTGHPGPPDAPAGQSSMEESWFPVE